MQFVGSLLPFGLKGLYYHFPEAKIVTSASDASDASAINNSCNDIR